MRLGVILSGVGVYGAVGAGVLCELMRRQIEPYAVCGLGTGAWPAALYAAGYDALHLREAVFQAERMGKRLLKRAGSARTLLHGRAKALYNPSGMQRLLNAQSSSMLLMQCPHRAIFPVRTARRGQTLLFSTRAFPPVEGAMITLQASAAFAVRACMSMPPLLEPLEWMGSPLLPVWDTGAAAQQLFALGVQRVLLVEAQPSPRSELDALDLMARNVQMPHSPLLQGMVRLCVPLAEGVHALSLDAMTLCAQAGKKMAERELDHLLSCMGMASCRILPFQRD